MLAVVVDIQLDMGLAQKDRGWDQEDIGMARLDMGQELQDIGLALLDMEQGQFHQVALGHKTEEVL